MEHYWCAFAGFTLVYTDLPLRSDSLLCFSLSRRFPTKCVRVHRLAPCYSQDL